jgi:hypothetical protein
MRRSLLLSLAGAVLASLVFLSAASSSDNTAGRQFACDDNGPLCAEPDNPVNYEGNYIGHDEPAVVFYSNTAGSGNSSKYTLTLPTEPPTLPTQDGSGGTYTFQDRIAFWFGMALCDDQSGPNPGGSELAGPQVPCTPNSDANIYTGTDPSGPNYIGQHPGIGFLELQFYPPGWVKWPPGLSCDPAKWCAAVAIFQLNENQNTLQLNNNSCLESVGLEPANFAFVTRSGVPVGPPDPLGINLASYTPDPSKVLMMGAGDRVVVDIHDTASGLKFVLSDVTKGQTGSMTASADNGFAAVNFDPNASECTETPHSWHPAYATSSEDTRVPWAAHTYNVSFSDEIGHFEYCDAVDAQGGDCTDPGVGDTSLDGDDSYCFAPPFGTPFQGTKVKIGGCLSTDNDFDGVSYQTAWPGTFSNPADDAAVHPSSVLFTSPKFNGTQNYNRVAFEADLPRIEAADFGGNCNRTTGANCVNPPPGSNFYPFYSTGTSGGQCVWQLGGPYIPGTTNTFGGSSAAEFGPLLFSYYPTPAGAIQRTNNFRNVLGANPCPA